MYGYHRYETTVKAEADGFDSLHVILKPLTVEQLLGLIREDMRVSVASAARAEETARNGVAIAEKSREDAVAAAASMEAATQEAIEAMKAEAERKASQRSFWRASSGDRIGVGTYVTGLGAGILAFGLFENVNTVSYVNGNRFSKAEGAATIRNIAYVAGAVTALTGISVQIYIYGR
jgi:hypothetical protein